MNCLTAIARFGLTTQVLGRISTLPTILHPNGSLVTHRSGAVARRVMGTTVIGGMLAATLIAIFLIPVTYYVVERFADRRGERAAQDAVRAGAN